MFLTGSALPYSFYGLLIEESKKVNDSVAFRPDRIITERYGENMGLEIFCNEINNVSPMSTVVGVEYLLPSRLFIETFLEVGS
jgi:hypothetical protein